MTPPGPDNYGTEFSDAMDMLNAEDGPSSPDNKEPVTPPVEGEEPPPTEEEEEIPVEGEEDEEESEETDEEEERKEEEEVEPEPEPALRLHPRPTVRDITTKYPNFFKEFPDMKHVLFREGKYAELFPTVEDAKESHEKASSFDNFSTLITSGKTPDFTEFLKGVDEVKGLPSMAANFLPALFNVNKDMYYQVTGPIAEQLLRNAYRVASQGGNENLKNAAMHIAQWAFGDAQFATGEKQTPPLKVEEPQSDPKFEQEKKDFYATKYNDTKSYVDGQATTRMMSEIRKGLDPNNAFTPFTQGLLVKQVFEEIGALLEADKSHIAVMNSMWKQAQKAGFAGNWKDRILSTYLSRARQLMPAIRTKIRTAALNQERSSSEQTLRVAQRSGNRREVQGSQNSSRNGPSRQPVPAGQVDWSKTSDIDFINDRVTYKKR